MLMMRSRWHEPSQRVDTVFFGSASSKLGLLQVQQMLRRFPLFFCVVVSDRVRRAFRSLIVRFHGLIRDWQFQLKRQEESAGPVARLANLKSPGSICNECFLSELADRKRLGEGLCQAVKVA